MTVTNTTDEIVIDTDEAQIKLIKRNYRNAPSVRDMWKSTRVHIWGIDKIIEIKESSDALPAPKNRGEDVENDHAYDRHNRLYAKLSRGIADTAIETLMREGVIAKADVKLRFSRTAGCSCSCSPGVIVSQRLVTTGGFPQGVDIYVTLK